MGGPSCPCHRPRRGHAHSESPPVRTTRAGSYRTLLAYPVVARTFALALVGRLGYAVLPLPLTFLFTVRQTTGSFAGAATAMAVFGSTTIVLPLQAVAAPDGPSSPGGTAGAPGDASAAARRGSPLGLAGMRRLLALMAGLGGSSALM